MVSLKMASRRRGREMKSLMVWLPKQDELREKNKTSILKLDLRAEENGEGRERNGNKIYRRDSMRQTNGIKILKKLVEDDTLLNQVNYRILILNNK